MLYSQLISMSNYEQETPKLEYAAWARNEYDAWAKAKSDTIEVQQLYNDLLTAVDSALKIPSFDDAARNIRKLQHDLNNLYQIDGVFRQDTGARYSWRWWLRRLSPMFWLRKVIEQALRPLVEHQQAFNAATIHYLNETAEYLSSSNRQLKQLFQLKAAYFLQITPWIDVKIREIQMAQNFNIAHHHGMIVHEHMDRALQEYNELLQKQLQTLYSVVQPITILEQQSLQIQRELEDLWHMLRKADTQLADVSENQSGQAQRIEDASLEIHNTKNRIENLIDENRKQGEATARKIGDFRLQLESFEEQYYPAIRVEPFVLERIQEDLQQLKEVAPLLPSGGDNGDYGRPLKQWDLPRSRDLRYAAFEEIFRGSSEWLKKKMQTYVGHFQDAPEPILDIGCGRGEFLELMREAGKQAYGIELNEYESNKLRERGLKVVSEDAIKHLDGLADQSVGGVFCAQVVEHLTPEDVYSVVSGLHRKMKIGAPLLIETINPLSIQAFHQFYLADPTHIYPVHPQTLVFFFRYAGFSNVQVHKSTSFPKEMQMPHPDQILDSGLKQYLNAITDRLNSVLYDSAEYFVIGYKR